MKRIENRKVRNRKQKMVIRVGVTLFAAHCLSGTIIIFFKIKKIYEIMIIFAILNQFVFVNCFSTTGDLSIPYSSSSSSYGTSFLRMQGGNSQVAPAPETEPGLIQENNFYVTC